MKALINEKFSSHCETLSEIRDVIRKLCDQLNVSKTNSENIILAVNEACMNIIQHAYNNDPDQEFTINIAQSTTNSGQQELVIRLIDNADKIDPATIKSRDLDDVKPGGIGVHIIHELMDSAIYIEQQSLTGNILELRKII